MQDLPAEDPWATQEQDAPAPRHKIPIHTTDSAMYQTLDDMFAAVNPDTFRAALQEMRGDYAPPSRESADLSRSANRNRYRERTPSAEHSLSTASPDKEHARPAAPRVRKEAPASVRDGFSIEVSDNPADEQYQDTSLTSPVMAVHMPRSARAPVPKAPAAPAVPAVAAAAPTDRARRAGRAAPEPDTEVDSFRSDGVHLLAVPVDRAVRYTVQRRSMPLPPTAVRESPVGSSLVASRASRASTATPGADVLDIPLRLKPAAETGRRSASLLVHDDAPNFNGYEHQEQEYYNARVVIEGGYLRAYEPLTDREICSLCVTDRDAYATDDDELAVTFRTPMGYVTMRSETAFEYQDWLGILASEQALAASPLNRKLLRLNLDTQRLGVYSTVHAAVPDYSFDMSAAVVEWSVLHAEDGAELGFIDVKCDEGRGDVFRFSDDVEVCRAWLEQFRTCGCAVEHAER